MPIDYEINPTQRLVRTRAWGVLTDTDILGLKTRLLHDPAFGPGMAELSDVSAIERLEVSAA